MPLTVIIVSYNTRELLRNCLRSLFDASPAGGMRVVVIDNASADGSVEMVQSDFPQVQVIANRTNVGYAVAINQALRGLDTEFVLILNSDIEIIPGALDNLLEVMVQHPQAALIGPQLVLPDGKLQETWLNGFTLSSYARQQFFMDKLHPHRQPILPQPHQVPHLHGAVLLVRGTALRAVGLVDEGYWMYCEDSDWAARFLQSGWEVWLVPQVRLLHHHGASSRNTRAEMIAAYNLAAARYFRIHQGPAAGLLARWLGSVGIALRFTGAVLGMILTLALYEPLRRRTRLFFRAMALQASWRHRWLRDACVPPLQD